MTTRAEISKSDVNTTHKHEVTVTAECDAKGRCTAELSVSNSDAVRGTSAGIPDLTLSQITRKIRVDGNKVTATTVSNKGETILYRAEKEPEHLVGAKSIRQGTVVNAKLAAQIVAAAQGFQKDGISVEEVPAIEKQVVQLGQKIRQRAIGD